MKCKSNTTLYIIDESASCYIYGAFGCCFYFKRGVGGWTLTNTHILIKESIYLNEHINKSRTLDQFRDLD